MEWNDSQSIISDSERQNKWGTLCESMLVLVYFVLYTKASLALSLDHCFFMNDARYYGLRRGASLAPRVLFCMYCLWTGVRLFVFFVFAFIERRFCDASMIVRCHCWILVLPTVCELVPWLVGGGCCCCCCLCLCFVQLSLDRVFVSRQCCSRSSGRLAWLCRLLSGRYCHQKWDRP